MNITDTSKARMSKALNDLDAIEQKAAELLNERRDIQAWLDSQAAKLQGLVVEKADLSALKAQQRHDARIIPDKELTEARTRLAEAQRPLHDARTRMKAIDTALRELHGEKEMVRVEVVAAERAYWSSVMDLELEGLLRDRIYMAYAAYERCGYAPIGIDRFMAEKLKLPASLVELKNALQQARQELDAKYGVCSTAGKQAA